MRIKSIEFRGFKSPHRNARVEFSESNVTVIYGDNGSGKTSFLKAIGAFLSQDSKTLISLGVKEVECVLLENNIINVVRVFKDAEGINWSGLENSDLANSRSLSLGVERGIGMQSTAIEPDALLDFFMDHPAFGEFLGPRAGYINQRKRLMELSGELSFFLKKRNAARYRSKKSEIDYDKNHLYLQSIKMENIEELLLQKYRIAKFTATKRIQSALFDTLSIAINISENSNSPKPNAWAIKFPTTVNSIFSEQEFLPRLVQNKDRIIEALDDNEDNNFKSRIISILREVDKPNGLDNIIGNKILLQLFKNMTDELDVEKVILSSINYLVDSFNSYLIDNKRLVVNSSEVYVDIDGNKHSINDLSSGERHILTLLTLVLFEGSHRNFLIIDEPEISLNIKWQRSLMSIFSGLLPNSQIIVASHSPSLAKRNPDYLCELKVW